MMYHTMNRALVKTIRPDFPHYSITYQLDAEPRGV